MKRNFILKLINDNSKSDKYIIDNFEKKIIEKVLLVVLCMSKTDLSRIVL